MNTTSNITPMPSPDGAAKLTDDIMRNGQAKAAVPQGPPPALTPAMVEQLMKRFFDSDPSMAERATYIREADMPDPGQPDLTPLAQVVLQCVSKGGPEAQGIGFMYAAYGLWAYWRDQQAAKAKCDVTPQAPA